MSRRLVRLFLVHVAAAAASIGLFAACGGGSSDDGPAQASCPNIGEIDCPSTPPSFTTDVQPIIESRCYPCHGPGGIEVNTINFTSYAHLKGTEAADIALQIQTCRMPEPDAAPLTTEQMTTFLAWIACSEPNN